jgi:site-specific DNA recombinase
MKVHPRRAASRFLLSGLVLCGTCGKAMVGQDAKSGKFSYYICSSLTKRGAGACSTPYLNSGKFERLVTSKIKNQILTSDNLAHLVQLVNEEMDSTSHEYNEEMQMVVNEVTGVEQRLSNLYNAIENGDINYSLLKPRLLELKEQHDKLLTRKAELEAILSERKMELVSPGLVKSYVEDLHQLLDNSDLSERRAFIKSFVKEIKVDQNEGQIKYTFPVPPDNREEEGLGVLPIVPYGGRYRT